MRSFGAARDLAKPAAAGHEDLALDRQIRAGRFDQQDRRQPVLLAISASRAILPQASFADRAALDRGFVRADQALAPAD